MLEHLPARVLLRAYDAPALALGVRRRAAVEVGVVPRGEGCVACSTVCPENIDVSSEDPRDFEDCTLCLDCVENCPTKSLGLKLAKTPRPCGEDGAGEAPKES